MLRSLPAIALLFAASALAQPNRWFDALAQVKQFLELSDSQLQTILANNDDYNRWSMEKQNRMRQVQAEIAGETAREPLDPHALGIRYAEIETICRQMKDRSAENRTKNLLILSGQQKEKLKVLEDAVALGPVISEAQAGNLIGVTASIPYAFTSNSFSVGGSIIGGIFGGVSGCYLPGPIPVGVIRTGDFTSSPGGSLIPASRRMPEGRMPHRWFDTTEFAPAPARPAEPKP